MDKLSVECKVKTRIPTEYGSYSMYLYHNNRDDKEHLAFVFGSAFSSKSLDPSNYTACNSVPLVRIHSECFTGEVAHSIRCDCGEQLNKSMRKMGELGEGIIVYLRQEGRGIGLYEKLKAYNIQDLGFDTVKANVLLNHKPDLRTYDVAAHILNDLGCQSIQLLTNNPDKISQLIEHGINVSNRIGMVPSIWNAQFGLDKYPDLHSYMKTKVLKMNHLLSLPEL